ncbi:MAG TPA: hypothetical protein VEJ40_08795 [Pseudolabrys sp.]|nr:hypothetical protein [Pseudolabrys sp.]
MSKPMICRAAAVLALIALTAGGRCAAAAWAERPYNPPVGSRWIIQRDLAKEESRHENGQDTLIKSTLKITSELVIEGKTADGYRIAYRRIKSAEEGNDTKAPLRRAALSALDNITIRATTDARGTPLRVDNLEDVRQALRTMVERLAAMAGDPQVAANVRTMFAGMLNVDAETAARANLDELPALALGQNTGLKVGDVRRESVSEPSGIGPPLVKVRALSVAQADAATGNVKLTLTENYDLESIRKFLVALASQAGRDPEDMKKMDITLDGRTEIEVVDGMTRAMHEQSTMSADLMGNTVVTKDRKDVTVTPAR